MMILNSVVILVVCVTAAAAEAVMNGRAVYNIGHMVNAVNQIDEWLAYGSNALEADVQFAEDGTPIRTYHGFPCDAWRWCSKWASMVDYVEAISARCSPTSDKFNAHLTLMMFDVKLGSLKNAVLYKAGQKFARTVLIPIYQDAGVKMTVMISIPKFAMADFVKGLLATVHIESPAVEEKLGFEFSAELDKRPEDVESTMRSAGIKAGHAWLSAGATNWSPMLYMKELKTLVEYKNRHDFFAKVYTWTVDRRSTAEKYFEADMDAIITNFPGNVNEAIKEVVKRGKQVRLATLSDSPFEKTI